MGDAADNPFSLAAPAGSVTSGASGLGLVYVSSGPCDSVPEDLIITNRG